MKFVIPATIFLAAACCFCLAAPFPAIVQGPYEWTADVKLEPLSHVIYPQTGPGQQARYWYTILTITNNTGRDVDFVPRCDLVTDTFQVLPAGKDVPVHAFGELRERYDQRYPLLEYLELTDVKLLEGKDNAKDIAIIWPDFDSRARQVKLFIGGLSNETIVIDHPTEKDADGNPQKVYLRKTLEVTYDVAGDPTFRSQAKIVFKGQRWVMR